ncbi:MAG: tetratricopeptide repeat protein [Gemmataceae bacterium]
MDWQKQFLEAWEHHRNGRLDQAETLYRQLLAQEPRRPEIWHNLGVLAAQRRQYEPALKYLDEAVSVSPSAAGIHSSRAEVLRCLGQLDDAEKSCRLAIELKPDNPLAWQNLGVILFAQKRYPEAETALRESLRLRPDFPGVLVALADCLREQGRISESLNCYHRTLAVAPDFAAAHANLGIVQVLQGRVAEGLAHCHRAVQLAPHDALLRHNLSQLLVEYGRPNEALETLSAALQIAPNSGPLCLSLATAFFELDDLPRARHWVNVALQLQPDDPEACCVLGNIVLEQGDASSAAEIFQQVLQKQPDHTEAFVGLARSRLASGDVSGAIDAYQKATRFGPTEGGTRESFGHSLSGAGDFPRAFASIAAHIGLLTIQRGQATDEEIGRTEALLDLPWLGRTRKAAIHFALAQAYDGKGEYSRAAARLADANAGQKQFWETQKKIYDPAEHSRHVDRLIEVFSPDFFQRNLASDASVGPARQSERPVFIVGMPRSGTTLVEQILASHPQVFGAGELRYSIQSLARLPLLSREKDAARAQNDPLAYVPFAAIADFEAVADWHLKQLETLDHGRALRVVDKLPDNYLQLGFLATMFPKARFIHCRRDMRDVALSCWSTNFAKLHWSVDLDWVASRILDYQRLMEHWRRVLPVPMLEIDYEQLVADQEAGSRWLVAWLGLEWDPRCLAFYQTQRPVQTASAAQVREPIHQRSIGRWKNYAEMLSPVLLRLG